MSHHHEHSHTHSTNKKVLKVSLVIIALYMLVEVVGGLWTNSLALLSDAGHMFSDALALGLSLLAFQLSERPSSSKRTFGFKRFEILAAAINGLALVLIAVLIVYEAIGRFAHPPEIATWGMLIISVIGLVVNMVVALYMLRGGETHDNVNMHGAYLHVLGDLLGSVGAISAAILMMMFGWRWADPLASVLVALLIAKSGWGILRTTIQILMEGTPVEADTHHLQATILAVPGVLAVHDLHVWTITSGLNALSSHVVVNGELSVREAEQVVAEIERVLQDNNIHHSTIQTESPQSGHGHDLFCQLHQHKQQNHESQHHH